MKKIIKILLLAILFLNLNHYSFTETEKEKKTTKERLELELQKVQKKQKEVQKEEEKLKAEQREPLIKELAQKLGIKDENKEKFKAQINNNLKINKLLLNEEEYNITNKNIDEIFEIIIKINGIKPIKTLVISNQTNLNGVPKNIGELTNLEILGLYNNQIPDIPKEIGKLTNLRKLWLHKNQIKQIPEEIGNLTKLEILWLNNNQITQINFDIDKLIKLKDLTLNNNPDLLIPIKILDWKIKHITDHKLFIKGTITKLISELVNLVPYYKNKQDATKIVTKQIEKEKIILKNKLLKITDENIGKIFEKIIEINKVKPIKTLQIANQENLTKIPKEIGKLINLKKLALNNNKIKEIPKEIGELINLETLWLNNNPALIIPEKLLKWRDQSTDHKLFFNKTKTQIEPISELAKELKITDENNILNMNNAIIKKGSLRLDEISYNISDDNINEIFDIIVKINKVNSIKNLQILNQKNLTKIPKEIGTLTNLEILRLYNNQITEIPKEIKNLIKLKELILNDNKIKKVPEEIENLTKLEILWLNNNQITQINFDIEKLTKLEDLTLNNNPINLLFIITSANLNKKDIFEKIKKLINKPSSNES